MVKYCPRCGAQNDDDANFCIKCGYNFNQKIKVAGPSSPQQQANASNEGTNQNAAKQTGSPVPTGSYYQYPQSQPEKKRSNALRNGIVALVIVMVVIIAGFIAGQYVSNLNNNSNGNQFGGGLGGTSYTTVTTTVFSGSAAVNPNSYYYISFSVPSGAIDVALTGSLTAAGGSGNDVKVYVVDYSDFVNYENGHSFSAYYSTGQETAFNVNVGLPSGAGTYYVIFDNTFSIFSSKTVTGTLTLTYEVPS